MLSLPSASRKCQAKKVQYKECMSELILLRATWNKQSLAAVMLGMGKNRQNSPYLHSLLFLQLFPPPLVLVESLPLI